MVLNSHIYLFNINSGVVVHCAMLEIEIRLKDVTWKAPRGTYYLFLIYIFFKGTSKIENPFVLTLEC